MPSPSSTVLRGATCGTDTRRLRAEPGRSDLHAAPAVMVVRAEAIAVPAGRRTVTPSVVAAIAVTSLLVLPATVSVAVIPLRKAHRRSSRFALICRGGHRRRRGSDGADEKDGGECNDGCSHQGLQFIVGAGLCRLKGWRGWAWLHGNAAPALRISFPRVSATYGHGARSPRIAARGASNCPCAGRGPALLRACAGMDVTVLNCDARRRITLR